MSYTLFGANVSPFVRKCRVVLAEKGLTYTHESVNPFQPPPLHLPLPGSEELPHPEHRSEDAIQARQQRELAQASSQDCQIHLPSV